MNKTTDKRELVNCDEEDESTNLYLTTAQILNSVLPLNTSAGYYLS
jgi:hypothetical protein